MTAIVVPTKGTISYFSVQCFIIWGIKIVSVEIIKLVGKLQGSPCLQVVKYPQCAHMLRGKLWLLFVRLDENVRAKVPDLVRNSGCDRAEGATWRLQCSAEQLSTRVYVEKSISSEPRWHLGFELLIHCWIQHKCSTGTRTLLPSDHQLTL